MMGTPGSQLRRPQFIKQWFFSGLKIRLIICTTEMNAEISKYSLRHQILWKQKAGRWNFYLALEEAKFL